MKGFWYQYHNVFSLVSELQIRPFPFTDWTESSFYRPEGLLTTGPVFQRQPRLPTMLGQAVYTFPLFKNMSPIDLASMLTLLRPMLEFDADARTYSEYDDMTARELFKQAGVTKELYDKFLKPLLLVGLFAPPEELSAAVTLETLYFYAAAHQPDFDICWCRGSVTERIFAPLVEAIEAKGGRILNGQAVVDVAIAEDGAVDGVAAKDVATGQVTSFDADAVVFCVGINALKKIVRGSKSLSTCRDFRSVENLRSIDCIATRLWLDRQVPNPTPSNVLAGFEEDVGATFFDLNQLHDECRGPEQGGVITADFYHANSLMGLSDDALAAKVKGMLDQANPAFKAARVEDARVLRVAQAVTHFSPGSLRHRMQTRTSLQNVFMAGDWIKDIEHGANGLSQERALVTGYVAANAVCERFGMGQPKKIIPVEADEPHIAFGKAVAKLSKQALPITPW